MNEDLTNKAFDAGFIYGQMGSDMWWSKRWQKLKTLGFIRRNDAGTKALVDEMDKEAGEILAEKSDSQEVG